MKRTGLSKMRTAVKVLTYINAEMVKWGARAAIRYDFPDLQGLVNCTGVPDEDLWLAENAGNEFSRIISKYMDVYNDWLNAYVNLFVSILDEEESSLGHADEIFCTFVFQQNDYVPETFKNDLAITVYSITQTIYWLCDLVILGRLRLDSEADWMYSYDSVFEGHWNSYMDHENDGYRMLGNIMYETAEFYANLMYLMAGSID